MHHNENEMQRLDVRCDWINHVDSAEVRGCRCHQLHSCNERLRWCWTMHTDSEGASVYAARPVPNSTTAHYLWIRLQYVKDVEVQDSKTITVLLCLRCGGFKASNGVHICSTYVHMVANVLFLQTDIRQLRTLAMLPSAPATDPDGVSSLSFCRKWGEASDGNLAFCWIYMDLSES